MRGLRRIEAEGAKMNGRFDVFADDVRQRFRVLNDRMAGIENRLAA